MYATDTGCYRSMPVHIYAVVLWCCYSSWCVANDCAWL